MPWRRPRPVCKPAKPKEFRIDLNVPYELRGLAKAFGAKWDPIKKTWYCMSINGRVPVVLEHNLPEGCCPPDKPAASEKPAKPVHNGMYEFMKGMP